MLATANAGKLGRGFEKNAGEWTGRVEISQKEILWQAVGLSMYHCSVHKARDHVLSIYF